MPARLGDRRREHDQRRDLGDERLRRGDRDLRAGLEEQHTVGLTRDRRADGVRDRDHRAATLADKPGGCDGVGRLAGLGDGDHERPLVDRRRRVAELRPDVRAGRNAGPVLQRSRADERRVVGGPAGDQLDAIDRPERLVEPFELLQPDVVGACHPPGDRLPERRWLFVDLLEHEMFVAALLGGLRRPVDRGDLTLERLAVHIRDRDAVRADIGNVPLVQEDDAVRVRQDRGDVTRQERLAVGDTDDERHVLPGADQPVRLAAMHDDERIGTLELAESGPCGIPEVALVALLDEMRDRLGVRLGGEGVAARLQPVPQLAEVLDDPVVDDGDLARAVLVGMGVQVVRAPMGGPARVRQPDRGMRRPVGDGRLEVRELAGTLLDEQVARVVDQSDARRVVAAVFEPFEPFDQDRARLTGTGVSDDATHSVRCSFGLYELPEVAMPALPSPRSEAEPRDAIGLGTAR